MDDRTSYEVLENKLVSTRNARFNAHRRFRRQENLSNWSLTLSSLAVLLVGIQSLALSEFFYFVPHAMVGRVGVLGSLLVLILALMEQAKSYGVVAEHFHYSGKVINGLFSELTLLREFKKGSKFEDGLESIFKRYHEHINGCGINHLPIDDKMNGKYEAWESLKIRMRYEVRFTLYYCIIAGFILFLLCGVNNLRLLAS